MLTGLVVTVERGVDRGDFETFAGMEGSSMAFSPKYGSPS